MNWVKERDALIAQTKAFVQSIALRTEDINRREAALHRPEPDPPKPDVEPAPVAVLSMKTVEIQPPPKFLPLSRPPDQVDMQTEIRARIASFRAHQERFNRERHEYFSATLARLRASIDELDHPPPRAGK
jgi:hypothetical protein